MPDMDTDTAQPDAETDVVKDGDMQSPCSLMDVFNPLSECTGAEWLQNLTKNSTEVGEKLGESYKEGTVPKMEP